MARSSSTTTPDSLIDVLSEQVAREEAMLAKIQEAHGRGDTGLVMQLLGEFFSGSENKKGEGHGSQS
jgi:hypothetical protein